MSVAVPELNKSPERIAGMFDAIAGNYDFLNHLLSAGIDKRWRRTAIASLGLTGRERVLDLCTGTADLALAAIDAMPGAARVLGVDFAGAMLRVGLDKTRERTLTSRETNMTSSSRYSQSSPSERGTQRTERLEPDTCRFRP